MALDRRELLTATLAAAAAACQRTISERRVSGSPGGLGIPGPYAGRVVAVEHGGSLVEDRYQGKPVRQMIERGMLELTHAETPADAWRQFFQPGDVVGVKLNPVGRPYVISSPEVLHAIIAGLAFAVSIDTFGYFSAEINPFYTFWMMLPPKVGMENFFSREHLGSWIDSEV